MTLKIFKTNVSLKNDFRFSSPDVVLCALLFIPFFRKIVVLFRKNCILFGIGWYQGKLQETPECIFLKGVLWHFIPTSDESMRCRIGGNLSTR